MTIFFKDVCPGISSVCKIFYSSKYSCRRSRMGGKEGGEKGVISGVRSGRM